MAETMQSLDGATPQNFPRTGQHYSPLVDGTKYGRVYAHAVQTIQSDPETLYSRWKNVESFPLWQEHVVSCTPVSDKVSHWVIGNPQDPKGKRIEFDAQITDDEPGRRIAWESITEGVEQSGAVTFTPHPAGRGTIVLLQQMMKLPGGALTNAVSSVLARGPRQTVIESLRHFKEMAEAGEIPSVKGQPHGSRGVSGAAKKWMYGETNPQPPGTSESAGNIRQVQ